jgi:hypothetical protein
MLSRVPVIHPGSEGHQRVKEGYKKPNFLNELAQKSRCGDKASPSRLS